MQTTKTLLSTVLAISLISIAISINESYAQSAPEAFISNVIILPTTAATAEATQSDGNPRLTMITLMPTLETTASGDSADGIDLPTAPANKKNQSPFELVPVGSYDIGMVIPEGYTLASAKCAYQKPSGKWMSIGSWDGDSLVLDVDLVAKKAQKCTWKLALETP